MNFVEMLIYGATEQMRLDCNSGRIHVEAEVWKAALAFRWFFCPPHYARWHPSDGFTRRVFQ